jgi:DNA-binding NtrC family response regulator
MRVLAVTPSSRRLNGNGASRDLIAELLALSAEFDRRREQWRAQLAAMLRQHQDLEIRRGSALARALRAALDSRVAGGRAAAEGKQVDLPGLLEAYEQRLIEWALAGAHGSQKEAAGLLGLRATTLHEKMKRYGIGPSRQMAAS